MCAMFINVSKNIVYVLNICCSSIMFELCNIYKSIVYYLNCAKCIIRNRRSIDIREGRRREGKGGIFDLFNLFSASFFLVISMFYSSSFLSYI